MLVPYMFNSQYQRQVMSIVEYCQLSYSCCLVLSLIRIAVTMVNIQIFYYSRSNNLYKDCLLRHTSVINFDILIKYPNNVSTIIILILLLIDTINQICIPLQFLTLTFNRMLTDLVSVKLCLIDLLIWSFLIVVYYGSRFG